MTTPTIRVTARSTRHGRAGGRLPADITRVMVRELKPVLREPVSVFMAMVQPLVFLALFAPLLPDSGGGMSSLQWFVPGMVAMTALVGATITGSNLTEEITSGSHERLLVSPISRSALLIGRALKEIVPMLVQTLIIVALCAPFGFAVHPLGIVAGVVVLALFAVGVGSLSYALALAAEGQEWLFWTVQQTLLFPVLLLAGVLLPLDGAPRWLRWMSEANPLTHVVRAERALFDGRFPAVTVAWAVAAAAGVLVAGLAVGLRSMQSAGR